MEARDLALQWREHASSPNPLHPLHPQPRSSQGPPTSSWRYISADSSSFGNDNDKRNDLLSPSRYVFLPPPAACNTALIKAMGKAGKTDEILAWLRDTTKSAAAAATAAEARGSQTTASGTAVSDNTIVSPKSEPPLDYSSFLAALSACSRVGKWESALEVLRKMDVAGIRAETSAYNTALAGACNGLCHDLRFLAFGYFFFLVLVRFRSVPQE